MRRVRIDSVVHGDCLAVVRAHADDTVDLIVTDPPYGYRFMGKDWDRAVPSVEVWKECLRVLKPGGLAFVMSAPRQDVLHQMIARLVEAGFEMAFTPLFWAYASGFPKAAHLGKLAMKRLGDRRGIAGRERTDGGIERAEALAGAYGGFQPKPAVEVILVGMKPLAAKTYVGQALENRKGLTWLDDGRIPFEAGGPTGVRGTSNATGAPAFNASPDQPGYRSTPHRNGRFPANLLVSDDALNDGRTTKSGTWNRTHGARPFNNDGRATAYHEWQRVADSGSFSRYFSLDAWAGKTLPFLIVPKPSKGEKNAGRDGFEERIADAYAGHRGRRMPNGTERFDGRPPGRGRNFHPTVKPLQLMAYLIALGSRPGDLVLDPFAGSGTTCLAAKLLGRRFIGIEQEAAYVAIARGKLRTIRAEDRRVPRA